MSVQDTKDLVARPYQQQGSLERAGLDRVSDDLKNLRRWRYIRHILRKERVPIDMVPRGQKEMWST